MDVTWIKEGLEKPGKTKGGLAKAMGIHASAVSALLQGTRQLKLTEAQDAAGYLEVSIPNVSLPPVQEETISFIAITGEVAGGIWAEPDVRELYEATSIPVDPRWPADALFLLRVRGNSVNRKARDGDLVLCLDVHAAPRGPTTGDWVIAEREWNGLIETTVKQIAEAKGELVLRPCSDDPAFQDTLPIGEIDDETVRVRAFVLRFVREATIF